MSYPVLIVTTTPHGVHSVVHNFATNEEVRGCIYKVVTANNDSQFYQGISIEAVCLFTTIGDSLDAYDKRHCKNCKAIEAAKNE